MRDTRDYRDSKAELELHTFFEEIFSLFIGAHSLH